MGIQTLTKIGKNTLLSQSPVKSKESRSAHSSPTSVQQVGEKWGDPLMTINLSILNFFLIFFTSLHLFWALYDRKLILKISEIGKKINKNFRPLSPMSDSLDYLSK